MLDPIGESIMRSTQFRGPVTHEADVRRIAQELIQAYHQGQLDSHDMRTLADCIETAVRRKAVLKAV